MINFKSRIILTTVLLFCFNAVQAIYPSGIIKIHNAKLKSMGIEKLNKKWFEFIYEYPEVLTPAGKKYKVDQYCSFSLELDTNGNIMANSIKLLKHKQNFKYNLKAIQFLKETEVVFTKVDATKPVELEMIYESF